MKARLVLRLALLLVLSMCTDLIAIGTLAPMIVVGGPSIGDTIFSTITALAVIVCAPFVAALPPAKWTKTVASTSLILRVVLCAATAYSLTQPEFSANEVLLTIAALWGGRLLANESISRAAGCLCTSDELQSLSIVKAIVPAIAAGAWLVWLHLPLNLLPPASILMACACSYSAVAIVFFFWKELRTRSLSAPSNLVSHSVPPAEELATANGWNLALVLLQIVATFMIAIQFSLAISENYLPPPHPALHRDLMIISLAWISAGIALPLCASGKFRGARLLSRAAENRFLLLLAIVGLAPLVILPGRSINLFFIAISAAIACLISIACNRTRLSTNNRWLKTSITSFTIVAIYAVAVYMLFQQPIAPTYNQWRTLAVISEGVLLVSFLIWPATRGALVASVSYVVQHPGNYARESSTATVYLTDSIGLARAAMAAAQLRGTLLVVSNHGLLNWKPVTIVSNYFGIKVANPETPEFPFNIRDQLGTVVVFWMRTTGGFFEQNSKLIEICFPAVALSRLTITKATCLWQPWLKTVAISKIIPVTTPVSGRRR
jgi:hypothetical protein